MATIMTPQERFQKRVNSYWVRQQPIAVPSFEDRREQFIRTNQYRARMEKTSSLLFDYDDPDQINSIVDVLYRFGQDVYDRVSEGDLLGAMAAGPEAAMNTAGLMWNTAMKPLLHGEPMIAGLNMLTSFSETMDVVANPVKGYMIDGPQGFVNAIQRQNYDWDTGSVAHNMFNEIVSDPLNWLSLGAKAIATAAAKTGSAAMKATMKEMLPELTESATKKLINRVTSNYATSTPGGVRKLISGFEGGRYVRRLDEAGMTRFTTEVAQHRTTMKLLRAADKLSHIENTVNKVLMVGSVNIPWGFAPLYLWSKGDPVRQYMVKQIQARLLPAEQLTPPPIFGFLAAVPNALRTQAAMELAAEGVELPKAVFEDLFGAISRYELKHLMDTYDATLKSAKNADALMPALNKWAVDHGKENFLSYYEAIKTLARHQNAGPYITKLEYVARRLIKMADPDSATNLNLNKFQVLSDKLARSKSFGVSNNISIMIAEHKKYRESLRAFENDTAKILKAQQEYDLALKEYGVLGDIVEDALAPLRRQMRALTKEILSVRRKPIYHKARGSVLKMLRREKAVRLLELRQKLAGVKSKHDTILGNYYAQAPKSDIIPSADARRIKGAGHGGDRDLLIALGQQLQKLYPERADEMWHMLDKLADVDDPRPILAQHFMTDIVDALDDVKQLIDLIDRTGMVAMNSKLRKMQRYLSNHWPPASASDLLTGLQRLQRVVPELIRKNKVLNRRILSNAATVESAKKAIEAAKKVTPAEKGLQAATDSGQLKALYHVVAGIDEPRIALEARDLLDELMPWLDTVDNELIGRFAEELAPGYEILKQYSYKAAKDPAKALEYIAQHTDELTEFKHKLRAIANMLRQYAKTDPHHGAEIVDGIRPSAMAKSASDSGAYDTHALMIKELKAYITTYGMDVSPELLAKLDDMNPQRAMDAFNQIIMDAHLPSDVVEGINDRVMHVIEQAMKADTLAARAVKRAMPTDLGGAKLPTTKATELAQRLDDLASTIGHTAVWDEQLDQTHILYGLMQSKILADMELMESPVLQELMEDAERLDGLMAYIARLKDTPPDVLPGLGTTARRLQHTIQALMYKHDLYKAVWADETMDTELKLAFFDEIQNFADTDIFEVTDHLEYMLSRTRNNIENHITWLKETDSFKLGSSHNAVDDVVKTYEEALVKHRDVLEKYPMHVTLDIETTGKTAGQGSLLQIAYRINDGPVQEIRVRPEKLDIPDRAAILIHLQEDVMAGKYTAEELALMPHDELVKLWVDKFGQLGQLTEEAAFRQFKQVLDNISATGQEVLFITQNGKSFDIPFLKQRSKVVVNKFFELPLNGAQLDLYKEAKIGAGHRALTHAEALAIDKHLYDYFTLASGHVKNHRFDDLIDQMDGKKVDPKYLKHRTGDSVLYAAMPSADRNFARQIAELKATLAKAENMDVAKGLFGDTQTYAAIVDRLGQLRDQIVDKLTEVASSNRQLRGSYLDGETFKEWAGVKGAITAAMGRDILDEAGNIAAPLSVSLRKLHDPKVTFQFFNTTVDGRKLTTPELLSYYRPARSMSRFRLLLEKVPENVLGHPVNDLIDHLMGILTRIVDGKDMAAQATEAAQLRLVLNNMVRHTADVRSGIAQAAYMFNRIQKLLADDTALTYKKFVDDFIEQFGIKDFEVLRQPEQFLRRNSFQQFDPDPTKFFEFSNTMTDAPIQQAIKETLDAVDSLHYDIDAIDALVAVEDAHNVATPLLYSQRAAIVEHELNFIELRKIYEEIKVMAADDRATELWLVEQLKPLIQEVDTVRNLESIVRKLQLSPEQLVSELYHLSRGRMAFKSGDLAAWNQIDKESMFGLLERFLSNKEMHEQYGLSVTTKGDWVLIGLKDSDYIPPAPRILEDVANSYGLNDMIGASYFGGTKVAGMLKRVMETTGKIRGRITAKHEHARGSTLELLKLDDYLNIDLLFDGVDVIPLSKFTTRHKLDGLNFNHSIYGTSKTRREVLQFASSNPMKTLAMTEQKITSSAGTQYQYLRIMMDPLLSLTGPYYKDLSDERLAEMLSDHRAFRLAFLAQDKRRGYVIKHVIVNGPDDIRFARQMNAVVMPIDVYNRTAGIVNDFKITNGMFRLMNKFVLQPLKVGVLLSVGFFVRNIIDSNMKNLLEHGSSIAGHTLQTIRHYRRYTSIINEILDLPGGWNRTNISMVLSKPEHADFEEIFRLYNRFLNDGAVGMATELEEYYKDTAKAMLRRSRLRDHNNLPVITEDEVRMFLNVPAEIRAQHFKDILTPDKFAELTRLAEDQDFYRRAYQMHKHTRNPKLDLEALANYLKRPEFIPDELKAEFDVLYRKYGEEPVYDPEWLQQMHAGFGKVMGYNTYVERIVRLASYTKSLEDGLSEHDAMYRVLKTHFDYRNKTEAQLYGEMLFPFSTFAINNFLYWAEHMLDHPGRAQIFRDIMTPIWNLDEYSQWDLENRKTLQYQIMSGNPVVNEEGLTFKLNPSVMDMVNILTDPVGSVTERANILIKSSLALADLKQESWQTEEEYEARRQALMWSMVPVAGGLINRVVGNALNEDKAPLQRMNSSLWGQTSMPTPKPARLAFRKRQFPQRQSRSGGKKYYGFYRKSYKQLRMESIPFEYSAVKNRGFQRPYAARQYWRFQRKDSAYSDMASKSGKLKRLLMFLPTDKYNLLYKLRWIKRY